MGNRATVILTNENEIGPAIYLHWNGGPGSVLAFLDELERRGCRRDVQYASARLIGVITDFFDGDRRYTSLSVGVQSGPAVISEGALEAYDTGDNGVYVVRSTDEGWHVTQYFRNGIHVVKAADLDDEDHEQYEGIKQFLEWLRPLEKDYKQADVTGPEEFTAKMQSIVDLDDSDPEREHSVADALLTDLLRQLGYGDGIDVYEKMHKYYA